MYSYSNQDTRATLLSSGKIETVAIIGAGLSGIVSAVHLLRAGFDITVLERADSVGGAWNYDPQPDRDSPYPNLQPLIPDWNELERLRGPRLSPEKAKSIFAPPGPVYANMKSRGSKEAMQTSLKSWPDGIRAPIDHGDVVAHLQDIARSYHIIDKVHFHTRVESISKEDGDSQWQVQTSRFVTKLDDYTLERESRSFDAVVVATGRYGTPRVPDVPGLPSWKRAFPDRVTHSKQYRTPAVYSGKTVLVIGAFISASEITNELVANGATVYQSAKKTVLDFRDKSNHANAKKVAMVAEFILDTTNHGPSLLSDPQLLDDDSPIPGKAVLQDGRVLEGIHHVIIATGYLTEFPFLSPTLQQPLVKPQDADEIVVTTADGRTVHNLHEDMFYIPDPTLAFIGVTHWASTFSLYDFQAQFLAVVFAGRVKLPPEAVMKAEQRQRKARVLKGTFLNSIFLLDDFVIRRLLNWANRDLLAAGYEQLAGPSKEWWHAFEGEREKARKAISKLQDHYLHTYGVDYNSLDQILRSDSSIHSVVVNCGQ